MDRVDSLIQELSTRHQNVDPRFLTAVRPMVVQILDERTPVDARIPLMEMLAETFERDVQIRQSMDGARAALADFLAAIRRLLGGDQHRPTG